MRKKSGFWTVVFSFVPGAGEMYQGYMKRGISLMAAFFLVIALASFLRIVELTLLLPVIWFYAFFDSLNIRGYTQEEWLSNPDDYLFVKSGAGQTLFGRLRNMKGRGMGIALVIFGAYLLLNNTYDMVMGWLWEYNEAAYRFLGNFMGRLPAFAVAVVIIWFGVHLIKGGKKQSKELDDVTTYRG